MSVTPVVSRTSIYGPGALLTPANALTLTRLGITPVFLVALHRHPVSWWTWAAWAGLCLTDGIDGHIARRMGTTRSGAFLDPLADKVLVLGCLAALVVDGRLWWPPIALIAAREIWMGVYRGHLGRHGISVPANLAAKVKTNLQCIAAGLTMLPPAAAHPAIAVTVLWIAVALTLGTGLHYAWYGRQLSRVPTRPTDPAGAGT